jgi:hypothetical protein
MAELIRKTHARLAPVAAWTVMTDAPLKGLALAREAETILAWDEGHQLYLLDVRGQHRSVSRATDRIIAGSISDDGSLIALVGEGARLWLLGPDLALIAERQIAPDPSALAIDAHGRYVAVASKMGMTLVYNRYGRISGRFETRQPLAHLCFVPALALLIGSAAYGTLAGVELSAAGSSGRLVLEVVWQESLMSNVGRLTTSGDGGMVLASCFTHGIQRFDAQGSNEGSYHLGGSAAHSVPDFAGRLIAVSTLEGELAVLSPGGHVRWKTGLVRPAIALETDPLGRFLIYGHATGEVVRLDLYEPDRSAGAAVAASPAAVRMSAPRSGAGPMRVADWSVAVATSDEQAETAVLAVLDDPPRIGLFTSSNRLRVFHTAGRDLGRAPEITGVGRYLRTAPGWIAAATDRQVVLFDARQKTARRLDLSLYEISHLVIRPDTFGLAIIQERDRLGRATPAGRWVWKRELKSAVEDLALGPGDSLAVTGEDGQLRIFDFACQPVGGYASEPAEPLGLIEAPEHAPNPVAWLTLARRAQVLRGHDLVGRVVWESPVPFEGWQFQRLGRLAMISAPDGRTLAFDGAGHLRAQGGPSEGSQDAFGISPRGEPWRVSRQGVHLICSDLNGRVRWRAVAEQPLGPLAVGSAGVAVLIGRSLAWFSSDEGQEISPAAD